MNYKLKIIRNRDQLQEIEKRDEIIHLSYRPTAKDLQTIYEKDSVKLIQMPASIIESLAESFSFICEDVLNIKTAEGDLIGFRTDLNEAHISEEEQEFLTEYAQNKQDWETVRDNLGDMFPNFSLLFIEKLYELIVEKKRY